MFDQNFIERLAQALAARIVPQLPNSETARHLPRLLTAAEAARFLGRKTPQAVYHLASRGQLPCVRNDHTVRFDVNDLVRWVQKGKRKKSLRADSKSKKG